MTEATTSGPRPGEGAEGAAQSTVRAFQVSVSYEELADLRRRITAMRWPSPETVGDRSQGVQLATMQKLAHRWATDYDWRRVEARLQALPQFARRARA